MGDLVHIHTTVLCLLGVVTVTALQLTDNEYNNTLYTHVHCIIPITKPVEHRKTQKDVILKKN